VSGQRGHMRQTINMNATDNKRDMALVKKARAGDKHAFDTLIQKYELRIVKLVNRYINDPSESLDISQETFLKAYRALEHFRGESAFYTWLYRIAINTAKSHVVAKNRRFIETDIELLDVEKNPMKIGIKYYTLPETQILENEVEEEINEIIQKLPKELRVAIILREMEGLSYDEIAHIMGCPIGTVRSRIFRAREIIERHMRTYFKE
jgi:RNA polymerase sigma-70 factor, ECF subfamily